MRRLYNVTAAVIAFIVLIISVSIQVLANSKENSITHTESTTLDEQLAHNVEKYHIPGMDVMEVDSDGVVFEGTYGDCGSVDQTFIIGSLSKSFTALAVMQLSEEGKINIDAPISDYIDCKDWFADRTDYERISVRDLLNQTSGIETYAKLGKFVSTDTYGSHIYANANYGLLGLIIESVSGVSYEEYINANVFIPLGMTHSYASYSDEMKRRLLSGNRNYFGLFVEGDPDYPGELKEVQ
ncbi:MAG: beta-lactamase family protein [Eubacterium sp.]|nr:beta-lactamase family protein [Eubacterium sp.]